MNEQFDPEVYCSYYHSNLCHVCKISGKLKRCSQCRSIAYCSQEHQKFDWKYHKKFCAAMTRANSDCEFIAIRNFEDLLTVKKIKFRLLCKYLQRQLSIYENQICMFSRHCEICYSPNIYSECDKCKSVFFCSDDHKFKFEHFHQKNCSEFKLNLEIGLFTKFNNEEVDLFVCDISKKLQTLPHSLSELVELYDKSSKHGYDDIMQKLRKHDCLSPIATILYGLEQSNLIVDRIAVKDELTIHIVGGSIYETVRQWRHMAELGFHWIHNLVKLDFMVIGPELDFDGTTVFTHQLCETCEQRKCQTMCSFHTQLYHDKINHIKKPDAVVAFNSGLHTCYSEKLVNEDDLPEYLWANSIKYLVKNKNTPLILTAFTLKEIEKDVEVVKNHAESELKVLIPPSSNPFADSKPIRDIESQQEPFFYINGFVSVLTRI
ncbi:uncharacterized protein LOC130892442 [Diorhabda carinulata]|uniref:uncharacterized protein LOC130892442 n=1 Tax=Diorhabda carinulata TaxID=1163345 RepID=UPI0025A1CE51|nr:uncharacterized protein LOC130892442 [Diorhabda carinulata]